jgi:hypothetical protein
MLIGAAALKTVAISQRPEHASAISAAPIRPISLPTTPSLVTWSAQEFLV